MMARFVVVSGVMSNRAARRQQGQPEQRSTPTPFQMMRAAQEHVAAVESHRADVLGGLSSLAEQRRRVETDVSAMVQVARTGRHSWAAIGQALGVTGEAARVRYGRIHRARSVGGNAARTRRSAGREPDAP